MAEASIKIECPWRSRNAGRPLEITAARCVLTKSQPEYLVRCFKAGCKGWEEPKEKAAEAAPAAAPKPEQPEAAPATAEPAADHLNGSDKMVPVGPEASPVEGPRLVPARLCACGCGEEAAPRSKYANKNCRDRLSYKNNRERVLEKIRRRRAAKKAEAQTGPAPESKGPKPLKARKALKEDPQRHHSGGRTEKVEPPAPGPLICRKCQQPAEKLNVAGWCSGCASAHMTERKRVREARASDPLAALLEGHTELLDQIKELAEEELRTPQAQAIYLLREHLAIHAEAVRLAAEAVRLAAQEAAA